MQAEEYIQNLKEVFSEREDIELALIYGSLADHKDNARFKKDSDIDIGVISKTTSADVYEILKSIDLDRKIDIVDLQNINPTLGMQIIKNHQILVIQNEQIWDKWVIKTLSMYNDLQIENKTLVEDLGKYSPLD